jgi:hypothetical protein
MTRNCTRAGRERTNRTPTERRRPGRRSSRNRLGEAARNATTEPAPPSEAVDALFIDGASAPEPCDVDPDPLCDVTGALGDSARVGGRTRTAADPSWAAVFTTGIDDGVVTETVATGVVTPTATGAVGTTGFDDGVATETEATGVVAPTVTTGTATGTFAAVVVPTDAVADTVGVWMIGTVVGSVTVAPSGPAVASTFAPKKPDTAKQASTTIILDFTLSSPRRQDSSALKNYLHFQRFW